jgi:hypothetical protein
MSEPLWQPRTDRAARSLGLGFVLGGAGLLGFQLKLVLNGVAAHAERVNSFTAALALGEMGVALGLYWIVRGLAGYASIRNLTSTPRGKRWLFIASAAAIFATILGAKAWLRSLGYGD